MASTEEACPPPTLFPRPRTPAPSAGVQRLQKPVLNAALQDRLTPPRSVSEAGAPSWPLWLGPGTLSLAGDPRLLTAAHRPRPLRAATH